MFPDDNFLIYSEKLKIPGKEYHEMTPLEKYAIDNEKIYKEMYEAQVSILKAMCSKLL